MTLASLDDKDVELAKTDLAGLHQQHAATWASFNSALQIVILVEAIPWATAGTLLSRSQNPDTLIGLLEHPGRVLAFVLLFTGLAGAVGYTTLVYNRQSTLFFARAINGYRALFADVLPAVTTFLPVTSDVPRSRESRGIMYVLSWSLILLNAIYLGLAVYGLLPFRPPVRIVAGVAVALATIAHLTLWYRRVTAVSVLTAMSER